MLAESKEQQRGTHEKAAVATNILFPIAMATHDGARYDHVGPYSSNCRFVVDRGNLSPEEALGRSLDPLVDTLGGGPTILRTFL